MNIEYVRPTRLEINLNNLEDNYKEIKKIIGRDVLFAPVLKSDAYGHGSAIIGKFFESLGADLFCVSTLEEGIELRKAGIKIPIILFNYIPERQFELLIEYELTPSIYSNESARKLNSICKKKDINLDIHIKVDTGMNRLGFLTRKDIIEKSIDNILDVSKLSNLKIKGIYSHLIFIKSANITDKERKVNDEQFSRLIEIDRRLKEKNIYIPIRHISNSGGILDSPEYNLDMVRCASLLYGYYPGEEVESVILKPALEFKTEISNIKLVKKNEGVSYGHTFIAEKDTIVGTIPVGYTDGYSRNLINKGFVCISGKLCRILGVICMDQIMVDLSNIADVKVGDEVVLFGYKNDKYLSLREVSELSGTIDQEILALLGRRVPRVYFKDGKVLEIVDYLL